MSNDVAELKEYVLAHASAQNLSADHVLSRITTDGDGPGSWTREWVRAGETLERDGDLLAAATHYNLARFPYVDGPARAEALRRCVTVFDRWRRDVPGIERLELDLPGGRVYAWAAGLSATERRPVVLMVGGIVSIKEQWAPVLTTPGVSFVNLQYGDCAEELALARDELGVELWTPPGIDLKQDLDDLAALTCALDLVLGFANATSNIAAACGANVWMIGGPSVWTQMGAGRYPWYPQVRAFNPAGFDDWNPVMDEIASSLKSAF